MLASSLVAFLLFLAFFATQLAGCAVPTERILSVDLDSTQAKALVEQEPALLVIDVRTPTEYAAGHIRGAVNIPVTEIERTAPLKYAKGLPILVYCGTGRRSRIAADSLDRLGYSRVFNLSQGIHSWQDRLAYGRD